MKIASNLTLPDSYVTGKGAILGRTGSGKTNTGVVIAEHMLEKSMPLAILDPQGDWWGLRSKYKIAILGGDHGDIPLEPTAGELAADFVIGERVPVLLDLFSMGEADMVRFAADFARRLWHKNRDALHVFLDEADLFAPQKTMSPQKATCLGTWQNIVRRGRSRGIGCTMITQRPAVLNKDLLTQADPVFVHRMTAPQDLSAIEAYLEFHVGDAKLIKPILADVAKLPTGECYVLSPGTLSIPPTRLKVFHRKSHDSSAAPIAGESAAKPRDLAKIDLGELSKKFTATIERAKADDPKELRKRIGELERQLKAMPAAKPDENLAAIKREHESERKKLAGTIQVLEITMNSLLEQSKALTGRVEAALAKHLERKSDPRYGAKILTNQVKEIPEPAPKKVYPKGKEISPTRTGEIGPRAQRFLDVAATLTALAADCTRDSICGWLGIHPRGGSVGEVIKELSGYGCIENAGGSIRVTDKGLSLAAQVDTDSAIENAKSGLSERQKRFFANILDVYPGRITREEIAAIHDIHPRGGSLGEDLGRLVGRGLVEKSKDGYVARDFLFAGASR